MRHLHIFLTTALLLLICSGSLKAELDADLQNRLQNIRLVVLDVDGTLTDGKVDYTSYGTFSKAFHVHDKVGIMLLQNAGIDVALISGENNDMIKSRAEKMKIRHVILECSFKRRALEDLVQGLNVPLNAVCYVADDVLDEEAMSISGFSACPKDAVPRIRSMAHFVSSHKGGKGAVREVIDLILEAQGQPQTLSSLQ